MLFDDDFLESLPDEQFQALLLVLKYFENWDSGIEIDNRYMFYEEYIETYTLFEQLIHKYECHDLLIGDLLDFTGDVDSDISKIRQILYRQLEYIREQSNKHIANQTSNKYRTIFESRLKYNFVYEFTEGDVDRIQHLINELRDYIANANGLDEKHRERLQNRLEQLQKELHKKMSNIDKFWGFVGDAGVVFGKLGNDASPFVEHVKEILRIIWRVQSRAEELPSDSPLKLPSFEESDEEC